MFIHQKAVHLFASTTLNGWRVGCLLVLQQVHNGQRSPRTHFVICKYGRICKTVDDSGAKETKENVGGEREEEMVTE